MLYSTQLKVELFKRGHFERFCTKDGVLFTRQNQALQYLTDYITKELLYGGAAGGAKSFTIFLWETLMGLAYPETYYFVAREELKDLMNFGLQTFSEVSKKLGLRPEIDFKINHKYNFIELCTKSKIYLIECKQNPRDPDMQSLGSSLYTAGAIEEGGQTSFKAYEILKSRVNRWKNTEYNILGKILITANPNKGYLYRVFYQPSKSGELKPHQKYLPALVSENIFGEKEYENQLRSITDQATRERLLHGNWEYDDDPSRLLDYDQILDLFTNPVKPDKENKYLSCDVARLGKDKTVVGIWHGLVCKFKTKNVKSKTSVPDTVQLLEEIEKDEAVQRSHQIIDEDGVGGGVVDFHKGSKGFVNNSKPLKSKREGLKEKKENLIKQNYVNLKTQCAFKFAELAGQGKIKIECDSEELKQTIIEELEQLKRDKIDKEGKIYLMSKDDIKENIGRSPDFLDALIMRMYFELKKKKKLLARTF